MAMTEEQTALIGVFPDRRQAEQFVAELKRAGFRDDQVGMATPGQDEKEPVVEEGAAAGALAGVVPGAMAGAIAAGLLPGVGPVIAAGILAGTLGGAAAGATAGGLLGALLGLGVPEEQARHSEKAFRAGQTLVVVKGDGRLPEALTILHRVGGAAGSGPRQA